MKTLFYIIGALLFLSFHKEEKEAHTYEDQKFNCTYETFHGRLSGKYVSYYSNGQKKSEGNLENNYRIGKWSVWDSTGQLRAERSYSDPWTYKRILPKIAADAPVELLLQQRAPHYSKEGYSYKMDLHPNMIIWAKRIWREVTPKENKVLFENDLLYKLFCKGITEKKITPYGTKDDEFTKELSGLPDTSGISVIGYKIKEDWVFDNERTLSEAYIIGICPIGVHKNKKDTIDLFWIYYPEARGILYQQPISFQDNPQKIKNLDDLFLYRTFHGRITKEDNPKDLYIRDYKTGIEIDKEAERIEISLIEDEHDLWISFSDPKK